MEYKKELKNTLITILVVTIILMSTARTAYTRTGSISIIVLFLLYLVVIFIKLISILREYSYEVFKESTVEERKQVAMRFSNENNLGFRQADIEKIVDYSLCSDFWVSELYEMKQCKSLQGYLGKADSLQVWVRIFITSFSLFETKNDPELIREDARREFATVIDYLNTCKLFNYKECIRLLNDDSRFHFSESSFEAMVKIMNKHGHRLILQTTSKDIGYSPIIRDRKEKYDELNCTR